MRRTDREILRLAVPALGALIAEPVFLLADTAMVGHLGADALGALAIASTILQTVLGLMIFLAYATTPRVAKRLGAGDTPGAVSAGFDGMWLAACTGLVVLLAGLPVLSPLVSAFGPDSGVAAHAVDYLTISWWGLPFMLVVIAATGLLRGLQDTRTPLFVAVGGFVANIVFNAVLIYGFGLGVIGSAIGTVLAQVGMCAVCVGIAFRAAAAHGATLRPQWGGVWTSAKSSGWLLVRNICMRVSLIALVAAATALGTRDLAAVHIVQTLFFALALALDSLAIAGQSMIGLRLGRRDVDGVAAITRRLMLFGVVFGLGCGAVLALVSPWLPAAFASEPDVRALTTTLLWVLAASLPVAGFVFVLDGVLMGAEDVRYLALAQIASLAAYLFVLWAAWSLAPSAATVWAAFAVGFVGARAVTLGVRARSQAWIVRAVERGIR